MYMVRYLYTFYESINGSYQFEFQLLDYDTINYSWLSWLIGLIIRPTERLIILVNMFPSCPANKEINLETIALVNMQIPLI